MAEVNVRVSDSGRLFPDAVVIKVDEQEIIAGQDGISPVVTVTEIGTAEAVSSHGYEVDVSDAAGVHTYSVYDGASAYAQAVAGGYSGTEEEFAADLIGFNTRAAEATAGATAAAAYADAASDSATAAATSESNAADSATAAASSASEAASSAGTATTAAGSASSSATAAAGSATTASNKASEAASSESNAASSATAASASATAAAASETAAASSASSAASSATAAAASAAAIEEYEHDAEAWAIGKRGGADVPSTDDTYHNNSKYYAGQAAASSSAANSEAAAAAQSARDAAASANGAAQSAASATASKNAAANSADVAANAATAAQGHATNAASSATAASGSATSAASSATAAGNAQTAAETAQAAAEDAQEAAEAVLASIPSDYTELSEDVDDLKSAVNDPVTGLDTKAPIIINSASGDIASFADGADGLPIKQLTVNVEPIQDLHGQASPYPAGGGPNKLPPLTSETKNGVTITVADDGTVTINGEATTDSYFDCNFTMSWLPGDTYYFCAFNPVASTSNRLSIFVITNNGNPQINLNTANAIFSSQFSADTTASRWRLRVPSGVTYSNFVVKPMLQVGGTAPTAYAPYSNICPISGRTSATIYHSGADTSDPTTYTIQLGDTVYGGTLDVTGGKMVVDRAKIALNSLTWTYVSSSQVFYNNGISIGKEKGVTNIISDTYKTSSSFTTDMSISGNAQNSYVYIHDSRYTDPAELVTALANANAVYKLATPFEITLTPTQIETLLGQNNIWSDAGDVSVDYRADTKLYIDNIHTPTDDDMTADVQIASDKYFLIGGNLYKSTTVIPAGDTIRPGTNCIKTNLAEALNALNA